MPELPEVWTITQTLKENIMGFEITKVASSRAPGIAPNISAQVAEKKITNIERLAKNIVFTLSQESGEDLFLIFHLAMTGQLLFDKVNSQKKPWERLELTLQKNNKALVLKFCDMRMFGKVYTANLNELKKLKEKYGQDIVEKMPSPKDFLETLRSKKTSVKNVLLQQNVISGVGNIYAIEALFLARILPKTPTQNITIQQAETLVKTLRKVLEEGIKDRGTTLDDKSYKDPFGRYGNHQKHLYIYGKKTCPVCNGLVRFEKINQRGTYFCPICQK